MMINDNIQAAVARDRQASLRPRQPPARRRAQRASRAGLHPGHRYAGSAA
jgi:hypothetical protein